MKPRNKTGDAVHPIGMFLRLLALAAAVLLAGVMFYRLGFSRSQIRLIDVEGDPAALDGFTLTGTVGGTVSRMAFRLENGKLTVRPLFDRKDETYENLYFSSFTGAIPPDLRDQADAQAQTGSTVSTGGALFLRKSQYGRNFSTSTNRVLQMLRLNIEDGTERRSVYFPYREVTCEEAQSAVTELWDGSDEALQDYTVAFNGVSVPFPLSARLGNVCYFALAPEEDCLMEPGIYRVDEALTEQEVAALPRDATVHGIPVRAASSPYGTLTKIWSPREGGTICGLTSCGGRTLCLAVTDESGNLTLVLLDGDGNVTDQLPVGKENLNTWMVCFREPLREDEICYYSISEDMVHVLRVANGRIVAHGAAAVEEYPQAAGLSEDASRILVASYQQGSIRDARLLQKMESNSDRVEFSYDAFVLKVYQAKTNAVAASAVLDTGKYLGWTDVIWQRTGGLSKLISSLNDGMGAELDTMAQRAAHWPTEGGNGYAGS